MPDIPIMLPRCTGTFPVMSTFELTPFSADHRGGLLQLINDVWAADGIQMALDSGEIEDFMGGPHFDPVEDGRVVILDGRIVAFGKVYSRPAEEREMWALLDGGVHPEFRGRGIGRTIADWQLARAGEHAARAPDHLPRFFRVEVYPHQTTKEHMFTRHGFRPVRFFEEMVRPLDDDPALEASGFEIEPWSDARAGDVRDVKNLAFRDHWGTTPTDAESWAHWLQEFGTRLDLSFVAVSGNRVVGYTMNAHYPQDEAITGRREGWIESLGTLRDWRGRGVATALLNRSFQAFRAAGFTHAALGVDSKNPTGARGLYQRAGFVTNKTSKLIQRPAG